MEQAMTASDHIKRYLIIPSGGSGVRMGADLPKQYIKLGDKTILQHTIEALAKHVDYIVLGISYDYRIIVEDMIQTMGLADRVYLTVAGKMRYVPSSLRRWWTGATRRRSGWVQPCLSWSSRRACAIYPMRASSLRKL